MKKYRPLIIRGIFVVALVLLLLVFLLLKNNVEVAEAMSRTISRWYVTIAGFCSSIIPFVSFTEILFILLFLIGVFSIIIFIVNLVHKKPIKAVSKILNIAIIALAVINIYCLSCEAGYNRKKAPLPYYENDVARTEYIGIYNYFASDINTCVNALEFTESGDVKETMSLQEIALEVNKAYDILTDSYYSQFSGSVKPMMSSFISREFQITGVTFSPLGEANINVLNTTADIPFTVAHELAHTKGVMREGEANLVAFYVCLNSNHPYLRLSAYNRYFYQIRTMGSGTYLTDEERTKLVKLDAQNYAFDKLISYEAKFLKKHNLLKHIGDFFNNLYIKSSGVSSGTVSYSDGTEYVYDPTQHKIDRLSEVQKLFLEKYYRS